MIPTCDSAIQVEQSPYKHLFSFLSHQTAYGLNGTLRPYYPLHNNLTTPNKLYLERGVRHEQTG